MSEEEARREAAILAYEAEGNMKVQANMRRMQEQGVIKVARPSRVVVPASTAAVVASSRRLSLRSSARAPSSPASNADASCAPWSWENDETSNDSFSDPAAERSSRGDSPAGPAFVKIILPRHVGPEGRLPAPAGLADFLPPTARSLALVCDGESWRCTWSVGRDAAGASLAGNWRGFAEDQRLEPGDAVTLKKEAGATLRVTIHRARVSGALSRDAPGSFYDASCVKTRGEKDRRTHGTKTNEAGGLNRAFRARAGWIAAFAEAAAATDALFAHHGAKPGAAVVDAGVDCVARPGYGTDPATHAHSRRTRGTSHRRGAVREGARDANGDERKPEPPEPPFLPAEALPSSPNARSKETDREAHPADEILVTEPRAHAKRVVTGTWSPRLALDVQNELPTCGVAAFASPRPAERDASRARDGAEPSAREERNGESGGARLATREFENPVSFVSPEATPAPPSTVARACAAARAARDAGLRAPLRAGETRRRGSSPRNPMETPATPTSARLLVSSTSSALLDVSAGERVPGPGPASARRFAVAPPSLADALAAGGARAGGASAPRARRGASGSPDIGRDEIAEIAEIAVAANGERKSGATRRQTPRFVSSATGAAPMEGWTTPAASSRGTRQTRNARTSSFAKTRQTKLGEFASTPEGTPLSQVFKATKTFGGGTRGSGAANPEARQTISVSAFVTPVDAARERKRAAAAESSGPGAAVRAKRRRA